jgi:hypothetical protein
MKSIFSKPMAATPTPTPPPAPRERAKSGAANRPQPAPASPASTRLSGAELRNAQKEHAAAGRKIEKLGAQIADLHLSMAAHDQSDYVGLGDLAARLKDFEEQLETVEFRMLELDELLGQ